MSTSFSVASWTDVMGFSVDGLMVSNVLPSTPLTNSLLMKLEGSLSAGDPWWGSTQRPQCGIYGDEDVMIRRQQYSERNVRA